MSLFLRYSSIPVTLSRSFEKPSSRDDNGDLLVINFPNQWGSEYTSFATSGFISLASTSGIILNTLGFVDASGYRANSVFAQNYYRMNSDGETIDFFPGATGSLTYKVSSSEIGTVPNFVYNTGIGKLIHTDGNPGSPLHVYHGDDLNGSNPTREITTFNQVKFRPQIIVPPANPDDEPIIYPPLVTISGTDLFVENIQIGDGGEEFKGSILTHTGSGTTWLQNEYLEADGIEWNRYPKRAVRLEKGQIIFYRSPPSWASLNDLDDYTDFTLETLLQEFGPSDTIALLWKGDDGFAGSTPRFVKPLVDLVFLPENTRQLLDDPNTDGGPYISETQFIEGTGDGARVETGYLMLACGEINALPDISDDIRYAYAFSVTKGAYLTMSIGSGARGELTCANGPAARFKPSTANNISIRPDVHTSFNSLAENIDFLIYGKYPINRYDSELFDLEEGLVPAGLVAGFKLDANAPDAVLGHPSSGVFFGQYLDRLKTIPSGHTFDFTPKISINRNTPYSIASISSGLGFLNYYSSLSVSGATYSDQLVCEDLYLLPKPEINGEGKYIANALLTLDSNGKIISRVPVANPTIPSEPTDVNILISGNNECSLTWQAGNDGGRKILNYAIEFSANNGNTWTVVPSEQIRRGTNDQTSCTITDLQTSVSYLFRVIAQNNVGYSNPSERSEVFVSNYDVSQIPRNLTSLRTFGDELSVIELSWNDPDSYGASTASGYIIEESDNNGNNWIYHNTVESLITNTYEVIYGSPNGINYVYRVSAVNASGQGAYNFIYVSGNIPPVVEDIDQEQQTEETIANWDFGVILFTGVCQS